MSLRDVMEPTELITTQEYKFLDLDDLIKNEMYNMLPDDVSLFVTNKTPYFNQTEIEQKLEAEWKRRQTLGDDDLIEIFMEFITESMDMVPNILHYIWFGCRG